VDPAETCVVDNTTAAEGADWSTIVWECTNNTLGEPGENDRAILRNISVVVTDGRVVDRVTVTDGAVLTVEDAGLLDVRVLEVEEYGVFEAETADNIRVRSNDQNASDSTSKTYINLDCGSFTVGAGDFSVLSTGDNLGAYIFVDSGSSFTKTGLGNVVVTSYAFYDESILGDFTHTVSIQVTDQSVFSAAYDVQIVHGGVLAYDSTTIGAAFLYVQQSDFEVGGNLWILGGDSAYYMGGFAVGTFYYADLSVVDDTIITGGDGAFYYQEISPIGDKRGGGEARISSYGSNIDLNTLLVSGGLGGSVPVDDNFQGDGGDARAEFYDSTVSVSSYFNVTGGYGGTYVILPGAGGDSFVLFSFSDVSLGTTLYFTGGDGGAGSYFYRGLCVSSGCGRGGAAELHLIGVNNHVLSQAEANPIDVGFVGQGGNGALNVGATDGAPSGGDCKIFMSEPSLLIFRDNDISCTAGNGGDQYYVNASLSGQQGGFGGDVTFYLYSNVIAVFDDIAITLTGGVGGAGLIYSDSPAGDGGSVQLIMDKAVVSFTDSVDLSLQPGVGGNGAPGDGGGALILATYSSFLFENSVVIQGALSGYSPSDVQYTGFADGGEAILEIDQSPIGVFEQGVTIIGGNGASDTYASDGGSVYCNINCSNVWFNYDVTVTSGTGGDSRYSTGNGGKLEVRMYNSRISIPDLFLISGDGGSHFTAYNTNYGQEHGNGGEINFYISKSIVSMDYVIVGGGDGGQSSSYMYANLTATGGWGGATVVNVVGSDVSMYSFSVSGGVGGGGYAPGSGGNAHVLVKYSSFSVVSSTDIVGGLSLNGRYSVIAAPGGYASLGIELSYATFAAVTLIGGDTGSVETFGDAGNAGDVILDAGNSFVQFGGNVALFGGDGGDSYQHGDGGAGGEAILSLVTVFNAIGSDDFFSGHVSLIGGDGGDGESPDGEVDDRPLGGYGGDAVWEVYSCFGLGVSSWVTIESGDGGLTALPITSTPFTKFYNYQSSFVIGSYLYVLGGAGNDALRYTAVDTDTYRTYFSAGGEAYVVMGDCTDGGINVTGNVRIIAGDSGISQEGPFSFASATSNFNQASADFYSRNCASEFGGSITLSSGDCNDGSYTSVAGNGGMVFYHSSAFVFGSISINGGYSGESYYISSFDQKVGGLTYLGIENSHIVVSGGIALSGGQSYESVRELSSGGEALFLSYCSFLSVGDNFALTSGLPGTCTSDLTGSQSVNSPSFETLLFYAFNSVLKVDESLLLTTQGTPDACPLYDNTYSVYAPNVKLNSTQLFVGQDIVISAGDGGDNYYGVGADVYAPMLYIIYGSSLTARDLTIVNPSAGSSYVGNAGGNIFFQSDLFTQILVSSNSDLTLRGDLSISGGYSGSSAGNSAGFVLIDSVVEVLDHSFVLVQGNVDISTPDLGDAQANNTNDGADAVVSVSSVSGMTIWGDFSLTGGTGSFYAYRSTGGEAALVVSLCSKVWLQGDTVFTGGDGETNGDGGDAEIYLYHSSLFVDSLSLIPGAGGDEDGRATILADGNSEFSIGGDVYLQGDDPLLLQRHSTLVIYPCDDANLRTDGIPLNLWFSEFYDCRSDVAVGDLEYELPDGDSSSDFDCTPCDCSDWLDPDDIADICALASPSPSPEPAAPDSDSIPSGASAMPMHLLSFFNFLFNM